MKRLFILLACLFHFNLTAQPVRVAVAANAQHVSTLLQADFKKRTGIGIELISGSSGKLATQIRNGAPFDLFLSADMEFPQRLFTDGFALTKPREYARGSLIVCSTQLKELGNWRSVIAQSGIKKIAIANATLAPYGRAAMQALGKYGLLEKLRPKLVTGESIAQVNTYIITGTVSLGFTTESLVHEYPDKEKLKWVRIDPTVYEKISQGMVVLNYARKGNYAAAMKFYAYLSSPAAKAILRKNGYQAP